MEKLEVRLLGGFELARGGAVLDQLPLRAARSLFAYLVLNRDRAHTRDLLAGTFWPDFDEARARKRLSQALWQVQTTLGEDEGQRRSRRSGELPEHRVVAQVCRRGPVPHVEVMRARHRRRVVDPRRGGGGHE